MAIKPETKEISEQMQRCKFMHTTHLLKYDRLLDADSFVFYSFKIRLR